jgi:hypothetical protein
MSVPDMEADENTYFTGETPSTLLRLFISPWITEIGGGPASHDKVAGKQSVSSIVITLTL